jgi:hypothetical protein
MKEERYCLIKSLSDQLGYPIICYVTSLRPNLFAEIESGMVPELIKHIDAIDQAARNKIGLFIISNGGDPIVALRIITLLRARFSEIAVIVPFTAYSAATLISLGADEIIMHPYANLGPLDMQLRIKFEQQDGAIKERLLSYEDIIKYFDLAKEIGITDQRFLDKAFERLTLEIPASYLGGAKRSSQLGLTVAEKLLLMHMKDSGEVHRISEALNSKYYSHGYPVNQKEAKELGLNASVCNDEIQEIIWKMYLSYADEMGFNDPFNPNADIFANIRKEKNLEKKHLYHESYDVKLTTIESLKLDSDVHFLADMVYTINDDLSITQNLQTRRSNWSTKENKNVSP